MKRAALTSVLSLAASLFVAPAAPASGIIMIDSGPGMPAVAMLPGAPVMPPVLHPPAHTVRPPTHARPPVANPPALTRPVLKGSVSYGLHLQSENVKVDITDQVARTYICQTFTNTTDRNLAGTYLFPLPEDTTFSSFSLHIDGKPVEGKILEAKEARQQYEQIVRQMVDPGLLEYADYKTVRARIFPIPAHGTKKVELEYTQVLRAQAGMLKYRFPLKAEGQSEPADEIKVDVKLASRQGLRAIWSPSHTIASTRPDDHHARIAYLAHDAVPDKDFLLYYSVSDRELAANLLTHKNAGEDGYFLLTLTPPVETKQVAAKDVVLVADTSGSMQGEKMEESKKALKYVVNALHAGDRFDIIQFSTDVERFKTQLVQATPENKKSAASFVDDLEAHGGTNIGDALKTAVGLLKERSDRPVYIVLMTDGEPTVGETSIASLLKTVPPDRQIRLFDFGVGYDVNTRLLNKLAEANHGTSHYVEPQEDMETALSAFYQKISSPILTDVKISYEGIETKNTYPREVKDIFAGSQALLIGRYKGSGKAVVRLTGKLNGVARAYSFPVNFASQESDHTYLPRLWAMRRIGYLTEVAQDNGNSPEVVDEIVALSRKYGIISAYTSFLVTDPSENRRLPATVMPAGRIRATSPAAPPPPYIPTPVVSYAGAGGGGGRAIRVMGALSGHAAGGAGGSVYPAPLELQTASARPVVSDARSGAADALGGSPHAAFDSVRREEARQARMMRSYAAAAPTGRAAVKAAKAASNFQWTTALDTERDAAQPGVKTIEDKTFYLKDGFWTDSDADAGNTARSEVVTFGSDRYFELIRSNPGISKYLAVGRQVVLCYKGHCYKIVDAKGATG